MSNVFVVSASTNDLDKEPRLAYQSYVSGATIVASHDQSNVAYIYDGMTTMKWRPAVNTSSITLSGSFNGTDYVAIAGANFKSSGCQVEIKDSGGNSLGIANGLRDNQPVYFVFERTFYSQIVIEFTCSNSTLEVGEIYMGSSMLFPKNVSVGYVPARWNTNNIVNTGVTQSNQFAGSVVRARGSTEQFSISKMDVSFLDGAYESFLRAAEGVPVFFLWSKDNFADCVFGNWKSNKPAYESAYQSSITLTIEGAS
jgi:hypothetical protein